MCPHSASDAVIGHCFATFTENITIIKCRFNCVGPGIVPYNTCDNRSVQHFSRLWNVDVINVNVVH